MFKEGTKWQIYIMGVSNPRDDLSGKERMSSEFKEIIMDSDFFNAQDFSPDSSKILLELSLRSDVLFLNLSEGEIWSWRSFS